MVSQKPLMKIYRLVISDGQCLLNEDIKKFTNRSFVSKQPELSQIFTEFCLSFELSN